MESSATGCACPQRNPIKVSKKHLIRTQLLVSCCLAIPNEWFSWRSAAILVDKSNAGLKSYMLQVITCAEFHPQECHTFAYSSSKGGIKVGDMRAQALCDKHAKVFEMHEDPVS